MKNILKLTALICLLSTTIAQAQNVSGQFVINGSVNAPNNTKVALSYGSIKDASYISVKDSTSIQNNSFTLTGYLAEPTMATLVIDGARFRFGIEASTMDLKILDINTEEFELKGSTLNIHLTESDIKKSKLKEKIAASNNQQTIDSLAIVLENFDINYAKDNPDYFFGIQEITFIVRTLSSRGFTPQETRKMYEAYPLEFKQTHSGKLADSAIRSRENTQIGAAAPEFKTTDINNNPIALSDFKHKNYVLLDAWASWCGPCVTSLPHIKELYNKYHQQGLEVIAISRDDDMEAWHNAIKKYEIDKWHNVLAEKELGVGFRKGRFVEDDIYNLYPILAVPKYFLIDKDGIIIGSWEGYSNEKMSELDNILFEIFNKK